MPVFLRKHLATRDCQEGGFGPLIPSGSANELYVMRFHILIIT